MQQPVDDPSGEKGGRSGPFVALRRWVGVQLDFPKLTCRNCEEIAREEGPDFDFGCATCPVYALPPLSPVARQALRLYQRMNSGFARDVPGALELMSELDPIVVTESEAEQLLEMLQEIHRTVSERLRRGDESQRAMSA